MAAPTIDSERAAADGVLLDRFVRQRDAAAFADLMRRHGPYLLAVCRRVTEHAQDAEDVFQACFLELVRKASSITRQASVAGWLQTVAVRTARKARARRARRQQREAASAAREAAAGPDDMSWRDVRRVLEEELARLPEDLRAPIIHCLFEGQTQEEAAQYLEVNPRTLKDRLKRGRDLLRQRLTRRGVTLAVLGTVLSAGTTQAAVSAALQQATVHGAAAVASNASLAGIVSPAVLGLTGSSFAGGWLAVAAVLLAAVLGGATAYVAWPTPAEDAPALAQELRPAPPAKQMVSVRRSFRNKQFDKRIFQWTGPRSEQYTRLEDEGLRITLPAENGPGLPVGVKMRHIVRGDFEAEATFEWLDVARPTQSWAGVTLYCFMDTPEKDGLWLGKLADSGRGPTFAFVRRLGVADERATKFYQSEPAQAATGFARVRLTRTGTTCEAWFAEGEMGDWRKLPSVEASDGNLTIVRFAADPVWLANAAMDVRLVEFAIRADEIVGYAP